jgi:2-dehydro-3-deoxygluconokinase
VVTGTGEHSRDLVTLGEALALLTAPEPGPLRAASSLRLSMAGAECNVAIAMARLGHRAAWIGRVGDDELGLLISDRLRGERVDVAGLQVDPVAPTALMIKERRTPDVVRVSYYRKSSAGSRLCTDDVDPDVVRSAALLHVTGITPALSPRARDAVFGAVAVAQEAGVAVSFDVNFRSALWSVDEARPDLSALAPRSSVLFAGEEELGLVAEGDDMQSRVAALLAAGVTEVVVKRGRAGGIAFAADAVAEQPAVRLAVVDPVGAGDAFVGGYLSARLEGADLAGRLRRAVAVAAFAVASSGDWEGLPRRSELGLLELPDGTVLR